MKIEMKTPSVFIRTVSILLVLTFITGQVSAGQVASTGSRDTLAASLVTDSKINPARSKPVQGDIAEKAEPGAIGNGTPLMELAQGKLPHKLYRPDSELGYDGDSSLTWAIKIAEEKESKNIKVREAIDVAIRLSIANQGLVPQQHQARTKQTLANLIDLQTYLSRNLYLFNADIRSPENYLLGFNFKNYRGYSIELIDRLYEISPLRLAQYIFHECVPEKGIITERDDHRAVYNEIQSAIFGKAEIEALKQDLREFIDGNAGKEKSGAPLGVAAPEEPFSSVAAPEKQDDKGSKPHFGDSRNKVDEQFLEARKNIINSHLRSAKGNVKEAIRLLREVGLGAMDSSGHPIADTISQVDVALWVLDYLVRNGYSDQEMGNLHRHLTHGLAGLGLKLALDYKIQSTTQTPTTPAAAPEGENYEGGERVTVPDSLDNPIHMTLYPNRNYTVAIEGLVAKSIDLSGRQIEELIALGGIWLDTDEDLLVITEELANRMQLLAPVYLPAVLMTQISEDLPVRAQVFKANLTRILAEHPDQLFFMGIEDDIGESQKAQIMPIYKAVDEIKELKDAAGKPLFPNLMIRRGKANELVSMVAELSSAEAIHRNGLEFKKLDLNHTFISARKLSVDNKLYDSVKGEGRVWISAIDDSGAGDYLPVFEAITLNMMAYLNADLSAIKHFYDALSGDEPIDPGKLQDMIRNRIIYILPRATKLDADKQLRQLYELAQQVYVAA
jgi:hypothetical protein